MSERAKLVQLPNGDWVAPHTVTGIKAFPPGVVCGTRILARLTVIAGGVAYSSEFPGMDEARAYADALAARVNGDD